jgi:hypothetical protein
MVRVRSIKVPRDITPYSVTLHERFKSGDVCPGSACPSHRILGPGGTLRGHVRRDEADHQYDPGRDQDQVVQVSQDRDAHKKIAMAFM